MCISKSVNHSRAPGTIPGLRGFLAEMFQVIGPGLARDQPGPLSMTTALPGTSDYTSTDPGLPGLNLDVPIIGISIYSTPYNFPIINTKS